MKRSLLGRVGRDEAFLLARLRNGAIDLDSRGHVRLVVDTGFSGAISLPLERIRELGLDRLGFETYELADGATVEVGVYRGAVVAFGRRIDLPVLALGAEPLAGMQFLHAVARRVQLDLQGGVLRVAPKPRRPGLACRRRSG